MKRQVGKRGLLDDPAESSQEVQAAEAGKAYEKARVKKPQPRRTGQVKKRGDNKWLISVYLGTDAAGKKLYSQRWLRGREPRPRSSCAPS